MKPKFAYQSCLWIVSFVALWISGCDEVPVAEAILAGKWDLIKADGGSDTNKTLLTLDDSGKVTEVKSLLGDVTVWDRNSTGTVTLEGLEVTIKTTSNLLFVGTFNDDFTEATGNLFNEFTIFSITTTVDEGEATLHKTASAPLTP